MTPTENWVNDFVGHLLELAEAIGDLRHDVVFLKYSSLRDEWSDWGADQLQSLIKIMTSRRLISRVAGYEGEELRIHPEARKMHDMFIQRLSAFEEEEEANFIEEEIEAERVQELAKEAIAARKNNPPAPLSNEVPQKRVPPPPPGPGVVVNTTAPSVQSLRRMYGGDDIRTPNR